MAESSNFVEKTLGVNLDSKINPDVFAEMKASAPIYTPPPQATPTQTQLPPQPQITQPVIQIIERVIYKKQRMHGFFRTLTIIALLIIWFLMLGESTGMIELSINSFKLHQIFPIVIILSTIVIRSYKWILGKIFWLILFLAVFWWLFGIEVYTWLNPSSKRKAWENINYTLANTETNLYLNTLIGNADIKANTKSKAIEGTRNSDRKLLISWGLDQNISSIKFNEDNNRNILWNYLSNINLTLPNSTTFDLIYIKNLLWSDTIDLNGIQRKMIKFHAGINNLTIQVAKVISWSRIEIQGTAANINLDIPEDIWVTMYYKQLIGTLETPWFEALSGNFFKSNNSATAKSMLNIYVNLAAGKTKINRITTK